MKNKILCVTPSEDAIGFLTAGKCYDIESTCANGQCVRAIDDQGDELSIFVDQSSLGTFRQLNMNALHTEALEMNAAIDFNTEQNRQMAEEKAKRDAFREMLCRGFIKQYIIAGKRMEVLWAILPNGSIYRTGELAAPNPDFDKTGREWTLCDISEGHLIKTEGVSFCGNYHVPAACK